MIKEDAYEALYPVQLKDPEIPIREDCSSDAVPPGATDLAGKKKVLVPELLSITKVLFDNYRLPLYSYLNRCLKNGVLSDIVGCRVFNDRIPKRVITETAVIRNGNGALGHLLPVRPFFIGDYRIGVVDICLPNVRPAERTQK